MIPTPGALVSQDGFLLEGIDTSDKPVFTVFEMTKVFFARSIYWVRYLENHDKLILTLKNGERLEVGNTRNEYSARIYTLSDVELMAHIGKLVEGRADEIKSAA